MVITFPPASSIFLIAGSEMEKEATFNLCVRTPLPKTFPGIIIVSPSLVRFSNLPIFIRSRTFDLFF